MGDYASHLTAAFQPLGVNIATLVAGEYQYPARENVQILPGQDGVALSQALTDRSCVLLHFSGYGYARRGLCHWLADGLERWKASRPGRRLVTMYHEVYSEGPIWRSSYWTSPSQKRIARRLAVISDAAFVSSEGGCRQLQRLMPDRNFTLLPVFSNIGEAASVLPLAERRQRAVVFGGWPTRRSFYRAAVKRPGLIASVFDRLEISEIIDIGPPTDSPATLCGRPVLARGELSAAEISECLAQSRLGLAHYRPDFVSKSGVIAAYLSHGLLVVNTRRDGSLPEGLELVSGDPAALGRTDLNALATSGHHWYLGHRKDVTAALMLRALGWTGQESNLRNDDTLPRDG